VHTVGLAGLSLNPEKHGIVISEKLCYKTTAPALEIHIVGDECSGNSGKIE